MISGMSSSSVSLALRTAQRAEQSVSKTSQQIATGKKAVSVKDDGASYARVTALNSDKVAWESAKQWLDIRTMTADSRQAIKQYEGESIYPQLMNALIAMKGASNTTTFNAHKEEAKAAFAEMCLMFNTNWHDVNDPIYDYWSTDPLTATVNLPTGSVSFYDYPTAIHHHTVGWTYSAPNYNFTGYGGSIDFNGTTSELYLPNSTAVDNAINYFKGAFNAWGQTVATHAANRNMFANLSEVATKAIDRIETSISSLTDADMGKVAKENELAQTRQELAYQTVKNAISNYGNVANGLMNNVLRTQTSLRA